MAYYKEIYRDLTLERLAHMRESEDHVEFKAARHNYSFAGGKAETDIRERRKCVLGYVVALANECGGLFVMGMEDKAPHNVCGSDFAEDQVGNLTDEIYERLGIRVNPKELYQDGKRVLVLEVPSRPVGRLLKFEGVALMRTGESLREMSDMEMFTILSEQEPDFSSKECEGLELEDLDMDAIEVLKNRYADKQKNDAFRTMSTKQVLTDLRLIENGRLNYAALILLGKKEKIVQLLPQCTIVVEWRISTSMIQNSARAEFVEPLMIGIDKVWNYINQPAANTLQHFQKGPYILDVKAFNEKAVREGLLNAMCHRLYSLTSDVVVKQYPGKLTIISGGGLPLGVSLDNIMEISSTPRNKRMCEILEKTGLVERSGQGVDKIFAECIAEGKHLPSYKGTDAYQVCLSMTAAIENPALHVLLQREQQRRDEQHQLNAFQMLALYRICRGEKPDVDEEVINQLVAEGLLVMIDGESNNESNNQIAWRMNDEYRLILSDLEGDLVGDDKEQDGRLSNNESNNESNNQNTIQLTEKQKLVLAYCVKPRGAKEIFANLKISMQKKHYDLYINQLIDCGLLRRTKENPKAKGQQYVRVI